MSRSEEEEEKSQTLVTISSSRLQVVGRFCSQVPPYLKRNKYRK
jgi:hypothetical protein